MLQANAMLTPSNASASEWLLRRTMESFDELQWGSRVNFCGASRHVFILGEPERSNLRRVVSPYSLAGEATCGSGYST